MHLTAQAFRAWRNKRITLLGMSGVGKTHLSTQLRSYNWFHYSGDYRIGTRYLDEAILDLIKQQAMKTPFLKQLLRNDWIYIRNNIRVDDLGPVLSFVGKLGNPEKGGVELSEFMSRQAQYRCAEIESMRDVPAFIEKAQTVYGYQHFVNDVGGSLCELDEPGIIELLAKHTLIIYIKTTGPQEEEVLIQRAQSDPKPLYYRPAFLQEYLSHYLNEKGLLYAAEMDPDDFTRWIFPHLFRSRLPRYEAITQAYGYTVTSRDIATLRDEQDFLQLVEAALENPEGKQDAPGRT
ncbi:MAG TPA: ATPase [Porticoccaceae bacterium]|nr:ATPase [Porticoccaceae bacterium]